MSGTYPSIAQELIQMRDLDQKARLSEPRLPAVDLSHTNRLKQIIHQIGWPTISKVGKVASSAAWLLAQHADHDLSFQIVCISMMRPYGHDEVDSADVAYLEDRICVQRGEPQRFGTQCRRMGAVVELWPVQDPMNLDARRKKVGLESSDEYLARLNNRVLKKLP